MDQLRAKLPSWKPWSSRQTSGTEVELVDVEAANANADARPSQLEDFPFGYPQYSALISSHEFFFVFRSFRRLRARLLLVKQNELEVLEAQLDRLDKEEPSPFFLGTCHGDGNTSRATVLGQLYLKLAEYDNFMGRCRQTLGYSHVNQRDIVSLQNWLEKSACLEENEMTYLENNADLVSLASSNDLAMKQLEDWIEDRLVEYYKGFRKRPGFEVSTNEDVYIYSGTLIKTIARVTMLFLITFLLLAPVVVCILVDNIAARILIIIASTTAYLAVLSRLTKSRMIELILAGATFATVLTVFVSNSNNI